MGNGDLGSWADAGGNTGLAAGDAICQARADAAGLTGTFVAWLSDDNNDAYCRIFNLTGKKSNKCGQTSLPVDAGPWVRTDGFPFGPTIDQIVDLEAVYTPVRYDEFGNPVSETVPSYFTGTRFNGELQPSDPSPCANWTSNGTSTVSAGNIDGASGFWTTLGARQCSSSSDHLLCFQTGAGGSLPSFTSSGKKVFVTSVTGNGDLGSWPDAGGNTGLAAGDAICQARASAAGLANAAHFKAWLSDSTTNAIARLTSNGPWVRPDGVKVADNKTDLIDGVLFTAITQDETGNYLSFRGVWTGTDQSGMKDPNNFCNDWTDGTNGFNGRNGIESFTTSGWTLWNISSCDFSFLNLYCFED